MAMPAVPAARSRQPVPRRRRARGIAGERLLPWSQSASTAMICGRLRLAMTAIDGSSPLALPGFPEPCCYQPGSYQPVPHGLAAKKKRNDVTGFTKGAGRFALVFRNDGENLPIVRSGRRHRHRLRLDRGRHRSDPDCADLSHYDLDQSGDRGPKPPSSIGMPARPNGSVRAAFLRCSL
jgi:hypothetical protein